MFILFQGIATMAATFFLWNLFSLTVLFGMAASTHFRGAVIEWKPLEQAGQVTPL